MKKLSRILSVVLSLQLSGMLPLLASVAQATIYYVAKSGNDSNDGSIGSPKLTIGAGLGILGTSAGAGTGHTVEVAVGTYDEALENVMPSGTSWGAPFTFRCKSGDLCTIRSPGPGGSSLSIQTEITGSLFAIIGDEHATPGVNGFSFDGINITNLGGSPGVVSISGDIDDVRFVGNEVKNAMVTGIPGSGTANNLLYIGINQRLEIRKNKIHTHTAGSPGHGIYNQGRANVIEQNEIYGTGGFGIHSYSGGVIPPPANNIVRRNNVYTIGHSRVSVCGIFVGDGTDDEAYNNQISDVNGVNNDGGTGICMGGSTGAIIYQNTIHDVTWMGIELGGTNPVAKNNIVNSVSGAADQIVDNATGATISNNFCGQAHANCALNGDPLFVNAAARLLSLLVSSPAKDAGATLGAPYNTDFLGVTRPQGASYDIGAYEFASGSVAVPRAVKAIIVE